MPVNDPGDDNSDLSSGDSGNRVRPIDAPDLPAWRRGAAAARSSVPPSSMASSAGAVDSEEDAPTQNLLDRPASLDPRALAGEDPRELARKLANEAKMRMAGTSGARTPTPIPQREPQDSFQQRKEEPTMAAEDPRELARRLAEEAKKRLKEPPAPSPAPASQSTGSYAEPSYAREPFFGESGGHHASDDDDAPTPYGPTGDDEDGPAIRVVEERPAAERVAAGQRPLSALEALALAREQERRAASQPPRSEPSPQRVPPLAQAPTASAPRETAQREAPQREAVSVAPRSGTPALGSVATIVRRVFPEAEVEPALAVNNPEVFRALWRAHGARALHEGDIHLVATASVLLDAVGRVPPGWLAAARMRINASYWAVWVDLDRGVLLGVARPAEVYLAGLA